MPKLKTILILAAAALFLSGTLAAAADLTGKWTGSVIAKTPDGDTNEDTAWLSLTQTGTAVTGTAGPSLDKQAPIKDAKLEGDQLEFKVAVEDATATVHLQLTGDRLKGTAVIETPDGRVTANLDLKRVQ